MPDPSAAAEAFEKWWESLPKYLGNDIRIGHNEKGFRRQIEIDHAHIAFLAGFAAARGVPVEKVEAVAFTIETTVPGGFASNEFRDGFYNARKYFANLVRSLLLLPPGEK